MARGSVYKRQGGWAYKIDAGFHPETGKRRQATKQGFRTKRQAEEALAEAQKSVIDGTVVPNTAITLGAYLDDWLVGQEARLRPSTHHSYVMASKRIRTHLGPYKLQTITPLQIESFYADLLDHGKANGEGLSPKSVKNTHVVLRKALADAERLGIVPRNAAAAARGPAAQRPELTTWSSDELKAFLAVAAESRLGYAFTVLATTGMRRGEALGLRWRDVDFDAMQIAVVQTLSVVDGDVLIGKPKTAGSRRTVYVGDTTIRALRRQRKQQAAEQLAAGSAWDGDNGLVFRDELGAAEHPSRFSRHFRQLVAQAALPPIRLHDLRHTNATLSLKAGVHPKVVSERLGHASIAITLDLYSHVTPGISREAADVVESMMTD
jgi:integrase